MQAARSSQAHVSGGKLPLAPTYPMTFDFEDNFNSLKAAEWFVANKHVPFILSIGVYLGVLYVGQKLMANREPIKARKALVLWNFGLAVFSIIGFSRVFPEFIYTLSKFGFHHTICNNSWNQSPPTAYWTYLFVLSKTPELVDTLFLVLRKQKLIFLHVYHHASVLVFSWFIFAEQTATARWFCTMNFGVHSIMYTYYALKAFPNLIHIPKWVSMIITSLQTLQMVAGTYVVVAAFKAHVNGEKCATSSLISVASLGIYVSYLILFSHFFYKAYCAPKPPRDDKKRV